MKKVIILSLLVSNLVYAASCPTSGTTGSPANNIAEIQLLVMGQSNAAGEALARVEDSGIIPNVWIWGFRQDTNLPQPALFGWEPATEPLNRYAPFRDRLDKGGYGWVQAMSKRIVEVTGKQVGIIVLAFPGYAIAKFKKGTSSTVNQVWVDSLSRLKGIRVDGIMWDQGEADIADTNWLNSLITLINDWRTQLSAPCLPWIAGEIIWGDPTCTAGTPNNWGKIINDQVDQLPSQVSMTSVVSSVGLQGYPHCAVHYGHNSYDIRGKRYADKWLCMQGYLTGTDCD